MKVLDLISNAIYIMEISYLILCEKGRIKLAGVVLLDLGRAPVFLPPNQAHSIFGLTSQSARPPYKIPSQLMKTLDLANSSSRWRLQLREDWAPWSSSHQVFRLCGSSQGDWWAVLLVLVNFILLTCSPLTHGSISWICYLIFLHQLFFFFLISLHQWPTDIFLGINLVSHFRLVRTWRRLVCWLTKFPSLLKNPQR